MKPRAFDAIRKDGAALGHRTITPTASLATLRKLAATRLEGRLVEFAAGCGAVASWLLDGMDGGASLTIGESELTLLEIARRHLGHDRRLSLTQCPAEALLTSMPPGRFDLVVTAPAVLDHRLIGPTIDLIGPTGLIVVRDAWRDDRERTAPDSGVAAFLAACAGRDDLTVVGDGALKLLVAARH